MFFEVLGDDFDGASWCYLCLACRERSLENIENCCSYNDFSVCLSVLDFGMWSDNNFNNKIIFIDFSVLTDYLSDNSASYYLY